MAVELIGIYGASGHGKDILLFVDAAKKSRDSTVIFIDDDNSLSKICGILVVSFSEFLQLEFISRQIMVAVADGRLRQAIVQRCEENSLAIGSAIADTALISSHAHIGRGALISPYVVISANVRIGQHFHCNTHSLVAHDCQIGDYVTFAPGVRCSGRVHIDDYTSIGAGALIHQGKFEQPLRIGRDAVVGMGAVVLHDVLPGQTVVGNPARVLVK